MPLPGVLEARCASCHPPVPYGPRIQPPRARHRGDLADPRGAIRTLAGDRRHRRHGHAPRAADPLGCRHRGDDERQSRRFLAFDLHLWPSSPSDHAAGERGPDAGVRTLTGDTGNVVLPKMKVDEEEEGVRDACDCDGVDDLSRDPRGGRGPGREGDEGRGGVCGAEMRAVPFDRRQGQQERAARRRRVEAVGRRHPPVDDRCQGDDGENEGDAEARRA